MRSEAFLRTYRVLEELLEIKYARSTRTTSSVVMEFLRDEDSLPFREPLDLCREVRNLLTHNAEPDGGPIVEPSEGLLRALERVVENLVHNAGKYARSTFDVEVGEALGGRVTATFANDVDAAFSCEVERLFEPFYTADAARSGERSGLGLAIARSLVGQMGGTLDACLEQRGGERWLCLRLELAAIG